MLSLINLQVLTILDELSTFCCNHWKSEE